jgi:hypothetical protein
MTLLETVRVTGFPGLVAFLIDEISRQRVTAVGGGTRRISSFMY